MKFSRVVKEVVLVESVDHDILVEVLSRGSFLVCLCLC